MHRIVVSVFLLWLVAVNYINDAKANELDSASTSPSPSPSSSASFKRFIYLASLQNSTNHHICNAMILTENWVLTLAQCVSNYNANELKVFYGSDQLNSGGWYVGVKEIHMHPSFNRNIIKGDLALLYTDSINFIANVSGSIKLPEENVPLNQVLTISGWMMTNGNDSVVQQRHVSATTTTIGTHECRKLNPALNHIIRTWLICSVNAINRAANICASDLGSALVGQDDVLYGISTHNEETCAKANVNIYTNVFTQITWINFIIYGWPWP